MLVFVYGTLKAGYGNNRLLQTSKLVGNARITGHELFHSGFPVMRASDKATDVVEGEIWDIGEDARVLESLDRLEGEGYLYDRAVLETEDGTEVNAYIGCKTAWRFSEMRHCETKVQDGVTVHTWNR